MNQYNPYQSTDENPQKERHNGIVFLDVKRSPLIDFEKRCFRFAVDLEAIGGANEAKLVVLEHLKHVLENVESRGSIFVDLRRTNHSESVAYSGFGKHMEQTRFVFVAYITHDAELDANVIWDWERKLVDRNFAGRPLNWSTEYGRLLWPQ